MSKKAWLYLWQGYHGYWTIFYQPSRLSHSLTSCVLFLWVVGKCLILILFNLLDMAPRKGKVQKEEVQVQLGPQVPEGENVFGVAHIFASFNDTFVHVTDLSGRSVFFKDRHDASWRQLTPCLLVIALVPLKCKGPI